MPGTKGNLAATICVMGTDLGCDDFREELSARLDGEDDPALRQAVDDHLARCAACATWWEQAGLVTRLARTAAALPSPALSAQALQAIVAAAPDQPRPRKAAQWLRGALLAVGLSQFFLGVAQISTYATSLSEHGHDNAVGSVSSGHLWHESAAWNVAIGAALAWLAWRRARPAGLLPVMTAFVAVLGLLTANDALAARVDASRVLSHSLVLAGYGLLLVMSLPRLRDTPPAATGHPAGIRASSDNDGDEDGPAAQVYPFPVRAQVAVQQRRHAA